MIINHKIFIIAVLLIGISTLSPNSRGEDLEAIQLPPPPLKLLQPRDREVILQPIAEKKFIWSPVEKAAIYHLEISTDQSFRILIFDAHPIDHSFVIKKLPEGTFYWHISSINTHGLEGRFSSTFSFFYPRRAK
ncbi:MAG: hypothetical protein U9N73_05330 [Candidatus Auribacterota bacterium]|nr:hypothetical protein [Candidatus Auribacterota bacterium]